MPFVERDANGRITAIHAAPNAWAQEELPVHHPELQKFAPLKEIKGALNQSDLDFIRVLDDLISLLIEKRVILFTDLPEAAREKLNRRHQLRERLTDLGGLIGEDDSMPLA